MFDDFNNIEKPADQSAIAWFEYGLKQGLKQKEAQSKWILDDQNRIICRNCKYVCGYDVHRGWITGSYCCNCGAKMEEFDRNERKNKQITGDIKKDHKG